ncbi:MAG: hypothetical protein HWE22_12670 [Flavobacteriales bacterium]|nr:hypothetical protein [Flavobacteriales bacterium]
MDKEKIEELKSKRLKLQEEVRLNDLRDRVASQISHLVKLDESYSVYYEFENLNWIDSNVRVRNRDGYRGIHGDFQIDVDDSNAINSFNISEVEINSEKFKELFSSLISTESEVIVCYQGGDPELEFSAKAFLDKPTEFFSRPETWILTTDKKWIIEYIWEQGVIRFIQLKESMPTLVQKIIIE